VTCLGHAAIVQTQKSVNTLRNNRGSGVYSVPFRAAGCWRPGRAEPHCTAAFPRQRSCKHADVTQEYSLWIRCWVTWHDVTWRNSVDWLRLYNIVARRPIAKWWLQHTVKKLGFLCGSCRGYITSRVEWREFSLFGWSGGRWWVSG
jgi:hypothetical protein